jgi:hypothetical protein
MKTLPPRRQDTKFFLIINPLVYLGAFVPWWLFSWQADRRCLFPTDLLEAHFFNQVKGAGEFLRDK